MDWLLIIFFLVIVIVSIVFSFYTSVNSGASRLEKWFGDNKKDKSDK